MKKTKKCLAIFLILAMMLSLFPAAAFADETTVPVTEETEGELVTEDGEDAVAITYIAPDGDEYAIHDSVLRAHLNADENSPMSEVFAEAGIPDEDLAECSYVLAAGDGFAAKLGAEQYENIAFFDKDGWRSTLLDSSAFAGGWFKVKGLATVTGVNHAYDAETHACANEFVKSGNEAEACGAAEPAAITYIAPSGAEYPLYDSVLRAHLNADDNSPMSEVFAEAGIPDEDLAECSYIFTASDGFAAKLGAEQYENFAFAYNNGWRSNLIDASNFSGGWFKVKGLATVTGMNHAYDAETHACANEFVKSGREAEACGAIEVVGPFEIEEATLKTTSLVYNGKARKPAVASVTATVNGEAVTLEKDKDYTVSYNNNTNAGKGEVIITGIGDYTGTITKTFTISKAKITNVNLKYSFVYYTGKARSQTSTTVVKAKVNGSYVVLNNGTDCKITYSNNKNVGIATMTVTGKGNYKGTITKTFQIRPKTTTLKSVTSTAAKKMTVKWTKQDNEIDGYQFYYSTDKNFASFKSMKVAKGTYSKVKSGLTSGKTYYVKIRTYKTVDGKTYYSKWSAAKSVKVS